MWGPLFKSGHSHHFSISTVLRKYPASFYGDPTYYDGVSVDGILLCIPTSGRIAVSLRGSASCIFFITNSDMCAPAITDTHILVFVINTFILKK